MMILLCSSRTKLFPPISKRFNFVNFSTKYTKKELQRIWTVPNALSAGRIFLTPILGHAVINNRPILALSLLAVSAVSDVADGYLARRFHQQSALGSLLDPIGDKLLVGVLTFSLTWTGLLPIWLATIILTRDVGLIFTGFYIRWRTLPRPVTLNRFFDPAVATATVHPTMIGKINTALQILLLSATLGLPLVSEAYLDLARYAIEGLQWTVAATTITSAISYIKSYRTVVKFLKK